MQYMERSACCSQTSNGSGATSPWLEVEREVWNLLVARASNGLATSSLDEVAFLIERAPEDVRTALRQLNLRACLRNLGDQPSRLDLYQPFDILVGRGGCPSSHSHRRRGACYFRSRTSGGHGIEGDGND